MNDSLAAPAPALKPETLARRVLAWWDVHRRELPWRARSGETPDPYRVWLSEVLLQQTTAAAAAPYFMRFVGEWPRVEALAAAPLEDIMRAFAGLGYYSRARNLHACAQEVARRSGRFPATEQELRALPGVGAYTAAAVAAIAFNAKAAPVDGNIARIVTRLHAIEKPVASARRQIAEAAAALTPADRPGDFAQALMDIGATICRPRNPDCPACPLSEACAALAMGEPAAFPRKNAVKARPIRFGAAFLAMRTDGAILARRRPPKGLLGATLELPGGAWRVGEPAGGVEDAPFPAEWRAVPGLVEQVFTHFTLRLTLYVTDAAAPSQFEGAVWVEPADAATAGFSSVMLKAAAHALRFLGEA
ncbi:MAG: A/G-specific adenine glycosylase [Hyphomicrobiales bacterium]|nr:A/G-specific adenine glycosylase [Hyphomicrobiales bacterium]